MRNAESSVRQLHPSPVRLRIDIAWRLRTPWRAAALLHRVALHVSTAEGFHHGQLGVVVVGAQTMRTVHQRHLGSAELTDVLTFDLGTNRQRAWLDAEIVLCADVARRCAGRSQARPWLSAARAELALYLTHGILHLAGYDDHRPADYQRMHAREDALLRQLASRPVFSART